MLSRTACSLTLPFFASFPLDTPGLRLDLGLLSGLYKYTCSVSLYLLLSLPLQPLHPLFPEVCLKPVFRTCHTFPHFFTCAHAVPTTWSTMAPSQSVEIILIPRSLKQPLWMKSFLNLCVVTSTWSPEGIWGWDSVSPP